jgi:hypothetical protein
MRWIDPEKKKPPIGRPCIVKAVNLDNGRHRLVIDSYGAAYDGDNELDGDCSGRLRFGCEREFLNTRVVLYTILPRLPITIKQRISLIKMRYKKKLIWSLIIALGILFLLLTPVLIPYLSAIF